MTLKEIASEYYGTASDAIAWLAVWKYGRSWACSEFWPDRVENGCPVLDDKSMEWLQHIAETDARAVFVNAYYCNVGPLGGMTRASLADGIAWNYENGHNLLSKYMKLVNL